MSLVELPVPVLPLWPAAAILQPEAAQTAEPADPSSTAVVPAHTPAK